MSFYSKGTPYLTLFPRTGRLQFRIRIPSDLQPCLGKREFRKSLGRHHTADIKAQALKLAAAAHEVFTFARSALEARSFESVPSSSGSLSSLTVGYKLGKEEDTSPYRNQEKSEVTQGNSLNHTGDTNSQETMNDLQGRTLASLTNDEIRSIADEWLLAALQGANVFALRMTHAREGSRKSGKREDIEFHAEADATTAGKIKALYQTDLKAHNMSRIAKTTDVHLASHGIECDPETENHTAIEQTPPKASTPYLKTCQEMMKAYVSFYGAIEQGARGDYTAFDATVEQLETRQEARREKRRIKVESAAATAVLSVAVQPQPPVETSPGLTVHDAVDEYITEQKRKGVWGAYSAKKLPAIFYLFRKIIDPNNSVPFAEVKQPQLKEYWNVMLGLPTDSSKLEEYRNMPFADLMAQAKAGTFSKEKCLSPGTLRNHFQQIKAFFGWAGRNDYHPKPSVADILEEVKPDKQAHERRDFYSKDDIRLVFDPQIYLTEGLKQKKSPQAERFWIPLLALFTGARQEELAQLHSDDIAVVDPEDRTDRPFLSLSPEEAATAIREHGTEHCVICLNIRKGKPYQTLKNPSSARFVPLSSVIIQDFNFLSYVRETAAKATIGHDSGRLFPELKKKTEADRYGKSLSRWYERYRDAVNLPTREALKDFHSFRDTVARWCIDNDVPLEVAKRYIGHTDDSMTYGVYAGPARPDKLYERITVGLTEYVRPLLDIEGLKASPFTQCGADHNRIMTLGGGGGKEEEEGCSQN